MTRFDPTLEELRDLVDAELDRFLTEQQQTLPQGAEMILEIRRMLAAGGKRLRPCFCYWGFRAAGGEHSAAIVSAASSLELLHSFALVHDDIMDVSDERRGIPTTFAAHGTSVALLVGDLALVLADAALLGAGFPPERLLAAFDAYSRMRQEVIVGQYLDVEAEKRDTIEVAEARRIAVLKSGRYSIQEPLVIGAALAGADEAFIDDLARFGAPLGEAFQLRDDLLGTFGDRSSVGKPVDSDIREGKRHVLFANTVAALKGEELDFFTARWGGGKSLTKEEIDRLRSLIDSSGGRSATESLLDSLREEAAAALGAVATDADSRAALEDLARRSIDRHL